METDGGHCTVVTSGSYSAWLKKGKSANAKAKWFASTTKRYFTVDFDNRLFYYSTSDDKKRISQPVFFHDLLGAEVSLEKAANEKATGNWFGTGVHSNGCEFIVRTSGRDFNLHASTAGDAARWVTTLNVARDVARGKSRGISPVDAEEPAAVVSDVLGTSLASESRLPHVFGFTSSPACNAAIYDSQTPLEAAVEIPVEAACIKAAVAPSAADAEMCTRSGLPWPLAQGDQPEPTPTSAEKPLHLEGCTGGAPITLDEIPTGSSDQVCARKLGVAAIPDTVAGTRVVASAAAPDARENEVKLLVTRPGPRRAAGSIINTSRGMRTSQAMHAGYCATHAPRCDSTCSAPTLAAVRETVEKRPSSSPAHSASMRLASGVELLPATFICSQKDPVSTAAELDTQIELLLEPSGWDSEDEERSKLARQCEN